MTKDKNKKKQGVNWRKPAGKAVDAMGQAAIERLKIRLGLNTETKTFFDNYPTTALSAASGVKLDPPAIPEGSTNLTRDGSSIRVTRTMIRGVIRPNSVDTGCRLCRVVAVRDDRPNGTVVTPAVIFNNTSAIDSCYSADLATSGITVLYDKTFQVGPLIQALSNAHFVIEDLYSNHHMVWKSADTAGTSTNLLQGGISVLAFEDAGSNFAQIELHRVTEFVDN